MKAANIDIEEALIQARETLASNSSLDPSIKGLIELLILIISILCGRLKLDSQNSSKPPSQDPNRKKTPRNSNPQKPGGQQGHKGKTLQKVDNPDRIVKLSVDRTKLPRGDYKQVSYQSRQVFDFEVKVFVTEYQAEILRSSEGKSTRLLFPPPSGKRFSMGRESKRTPFI
jgi:transposase